MPPKKVKGKGKAVADEDVIRAGDVEDDEFVSGQGGDEEDDTAAPPAKRKKLKATQPSKKKKRTVYNPPAADQVVDHLTQLADAGVDKFWLTQDHRTINLNQFTTWINENGMTVKPGKGLSYQPQILAAEMQHVKDLPVYQGRDFVLQEDLVTSYTVQREADGTSVQAWNLIARDDETGESVELFRNPAYSKEFDDISQNNAVDVKVCPTMQGAIELGRCAVHVMNRVPAKLDTAVWSSPRDTKGVGAYRFSRVRTFVDVTAFLMWDAGFDFGLLHSAFLKPASSTGSNLAGAYGRPLSISPSKKFPIVDTPTMALRVDKPYDTATFRVSMKPQTVDAPKVNSNPALLVPQTFAFRASDPAGLDCTDQNVRACVTVVNRICYDLVGMVGTREQINDAIDASQSSFLKQGMAKTRGRRRKESGSVNGAPLFILPRMRGRRISIPFQRSVLDLLNFSKDPLAAYQQAFQLDIAGATVNSPHRLLHAYVMQQGYDAVAAGKSVINVLLEVYQAADAVNLGITTTADAIAYFRSFDADRMSETEVICHHCNRSFLLSQLGWAGERLLCSPCSKEAGVASAGYIPTTPKYSVDHSLRKLWAQEAKVHELAWDTKLQHKAILETYQVTRDSYMDGYNGTITVNDMASFMSCFDHSFRTLTGRQASNPLSPSIDGVYRRWQKNNAFHIHHPENVVVTKMCVNFLKGPHCPSALPIFQRSHALCETVKSQPPVVGYHAEIAYEMETIELASDNIYVIGAFQPFRQKTRVSQPTLLSDRDFQVKFIAQEKSGAWDGMSLPWDQARCLFASRAELNTQIPTTAQRQNFEMWTQDDIEVLLRDVDQIEADVERFNSHRLSIPRGRDGRTPLLWRAGHMPGDVDMEFMFREFQARLWTWDEVCDENNETAESPATLFIEYVVQWFKTGGKCHIFGFVMTYAAGHLSVYAFARAVTAIDQDDTTRDVLPGEMMRTGCLVLLPKDMAKDYDAHRRTVIVESAAANRLRHNYLGGTKLIELLRDTVRGIATNSQFYGPLLAREQYRNVPLPTSWRTRSRALKETDPSTVGMVDDEILAIEEAQAEAAELADFDDITKGDATKAAGATEDDEDNGGQAMEGVVHELLSGKSATGESSTSKSAGTSQTAAETIAGHQEFFEKMQAFIPAEHSDEFATRMTELLDTFKDSMEFTEKIAKRMK